MDIRKWIARDGFDTNFLVELASQADETTMSTVTDSTQSSLGEPQNVASQVQEESASPESSPTKLPPTSSTPIPDESSKLAKDEVMTSIMDEIQQLFISVSDLKAENEALSSKALLRELEYKELKQLVDTIRVDQDKAVERVDKAFKLIYKTG